MAITGKIWSGSSAASRYSFAGLTVLFSRAKIKVEEGYNYGSSTEYVNLGEYFVSDFNYGGFSNERITLNASNMLNEQSVRNSPLGFRERSGFILSDTFDGNNSFTDRYTIEGDYVGVTNLLYNSTFSALEKYTDRNVIRTLFIQSESDRKDIAVNSVPIRNGSYEAWIAQGSGSVGVTYSFKIMFKASDRDNGYAVVWDRLQNNIRLQEFVGGTPTTLATSSGLSYSLGTSLSLVLKVFNYEDNVQVWGSTDRKSFIKHIDTTTDTFEKGSAIFEWGAFGISRAFTSPNVYFDIYGLNVQEYGSLLTSENLAKKYFSVLGVTDVNIQSQNIPYSSWSNTDGSSWSISNKYITRTSTSGGSSTGSSWDLFYDASSYFEDFVMTTNVIGNSGVRFGLMGLIQYSVFSVGLSNTDVRYATSFQFAGNTANHQYYLKESGASISVVNTVNPYIRLLPDTEYTLSMFKSNKTIVTAVNNKIVSSFDLSGLASFNTTNSKPSYSIVGVAVNRSSGVSVTFINPRVSILDSFINEYSVDNNSNWDSVLSRIVPEGTFITLNNNSVRFFLRGASVGNLGVSNFSYDLNQSLSNIGRPNFTVGTGNSAYAFQGVSLMRGKRQVDRSVVSFTSGEFINSSEDARFYAKREVETNQVGIDSMSVSMKAPVQIERGDVITLPIDLPYDYNAGNINKYSGIVENFSKSFSADGKFDIDITISSDLEV